MAPVFVKFSIICFVATIANSTVLHFRHETGITPSECLDKAFFKLKHKAEITLQEILKHDVNHPETYCQLAIKLEQERDSLNDYLEIAEKAKVCTMDE